MKKILFLLIAVVLGMTASAQITYNAKLGGGISSCDINGIGVDQKPMFVGKLGVGLEYPLTANLSLMPSLEFAMKGAKVKAKEITAGYDDMADESWRVNYLQIPVLAAYRFHLSDLWNLAVKAGPYFGYAVYGKYTASYEGLSKSEDIFGEDSDSSRFEVGLDAGVDFEYHRYVIGLEYERGFTNLAGDGESSIKNQAFYLTLGYKF